ncbi:MAG: 2-hydroxyacyl-CoA dehydratase subunit D [Deltaproteobacteria bacterium]
MAATKRLAAHARMKEWMVRHFRAGWLAREEGRKVAWVTSGAPVEFLLAFDVVPVYPENHGAVCGVARTGGMLCRTAEETGMSRDLCSYWRIDQGARANPGASPIGGLPPPDFLFCANNICRTVVKWYEGLARTFGVPLLLLDFPFLHESPDPAAAGYVREQFRRLPRELERITGSRWSGERFLEIVARSRETSRLWEECIRENAARPSPTTAVDQFLLMGPIVTMRGTPEAYGFYQLLRDEIRERVARGEGAIGSERIRLLWDNLPVWHRLRGLTEFLGDRGAVLVGATYTFAWTERPEGRSSDPIIETADAYARVWLNQGLAHREKVIRRLVRDLRADGVLFHANRSCKPYSFGQEEVASHLKETGIPCIVVEGDMADERDFSEGSWNTRLGAFLEGFPSGGGTRT